MPGTAGPRLGLVWGYAPGEVGWGVGGYNPNFAKLEALVHLTVIAVAATPPATPANGDCYIVAASPTGAWVGHADDIAVYYTAGGWLYIEPAVGIRAFDRSGDGYIRFDGVDWIDEIVPAADVSGPAGAVDGNIAIFDVTGKEIRDGGQALPTGLIVGTIDIQILENKIIDGAANSLVVHLDTDVVGNLPIVNLGGGVGASNTTVFYGDGTWRAPGGGGGGGASITVSDTPPVSPAVGQMWFDSTTACLFVWYEDSSAGQWVVAVNVGSGGGSAAGVLSISATGPLSVSSAVGDVTLSLDAPLDIAFGGHGADTAAQALVNLGAAPILSPVLLGTPTGPTASPGTATGQLATTAFVANAFGGAGALSITAGTGITVTPSPLTGVGSVALSVPVAISAGGSGAVTAPAALAALGAAPLDSPVFTGDARSVTPATADNDTSIATTAYVKAQGYVTGGPYLPLVGGTITGPLTIRFADSSGYQFLAAGTTYAVRVYTSVAAAQIDAVTQDAGAYAPLIIGGSTVALAIAGTTKMRMDAAGVSLFDNAITVGTVPPPAPGTTNVFCNGVIATSYSSGCYYSGGWKYFQGGAVVANLLAMDGNISFNTAPAGAAGATVLFTERMRIDNATGAMWISGRIIQNKPNDGNDAIDIFVPAGQNARIYTDVSGVRAWAFGGAADGTWHVHDVSAGMSRLIIDTAGACFNTSGSWAAISDVELKVQETIRPYTRGLEAVLNLNPITFQYAPGTPFASEVNPSDPLVGLLAHEVEPHIPEMCGTTTVTIAEEDRQVQTLNPGDLTYVLINAIKELEARVRELEDRPPNPPEVKPA